MYVYSPVILPPNILILLSAWCLQYRLQQASVEPHLSFIRRLSVLVSHSTSGREGNWTIMKTFLCVSRNTWQISTIYSWSIQVTALFALALAAPRRGRQTPGYGLNGYGYGPAGSNAYGAPHPAPAHSGPRDHSDYAPAHTGGYGPIVRYDPDHDHPVLLGPGGGFLGPGGGY